MSAGAAAAAAAVRRKMEQEEHEMTTYGPQDLSEGWEFKILRSMRGAFRDPERLKQILAEEGRAGWTLVEKFDNGRIRLKRPSSARDLDGKLEFDPYHTYVGPSENQFTLTIIGSVFGVIAAIFIAVFLFSKIAGNDPPPRLPPAPKTQTQPVGALQEQKL